MSRLERVRRDAAAGAARGAPAVAHLGLPRGDVLVRSPGRARPDALAAAGGWGCADEDLAMTVPLPVELPDGETIELRCGRLATSSVARRRWRRAGELQHHLIDPRTGRPSDTPWRDVSVVAASGVAADVAAKSALLLGTAGPRWLDRRRLAGGFLDHGGEATVTAAWRQAVVA